MTAGRLIEEGSGEAALQRALPLFRAEARERVDRLTPDAPYLDLLDDELRSTGPTQDMMRTALVAQIYERYWRPALGRVVKGIRGPGMAESGLRNLALLRGDATALPFVDGAFDGVCCFAALHLFADPLAGLDEMARVLAPGGRIALMTSVQRQLAPRGPFKPLTERLSGIRVFGQREIVEALQERGFDDLHQRLSGLVQFVGGRLSPAPAGA
jgi:SAM-dependent methyltransferase